MEPSPPLGSPRFSLRTRANGVATHVTLAGELDLATIPELRSTVEHVVAGGAAHVVIDLHELEFIDSSGLRLLLELSTESQRDGWQLSLLQGGDPVRRLFELTQTLDLLPFNTSIPREGQASGEAP